MLRISPERCVNRCVNIRMKTLFALAMTAIMLSACGPVHSWRDVSRRNRNYDAAIADHEACSDEEMPSENQIGNGGGLAAAVSGVNACMALRGRSKIRD